MGHALQVGELFRISGAVTSREHRLELVSTDAEDMLETAMRRSSGRQLGEATDWTCLGADDKEIVDSSQRSATQGSPEGTDRIRRAQHP